VKGSLLSDEIKNRIKQRVTAAVEEASTHADPERLKADVKQIIKEEMQATNLPDVFVSALMAVFMGQINVSDLVGMSMSGVLKQ